jgi:predicted AAA+ superfamily ATPase
MAAKDSVSNLFGGFTIFTDKPFVIKDRIVIEDVDGVVEEIGIRSTKVRTLAGRIVYHELTPFLQSELPNTYTKDAISSYWFRGGFPRSVLAIDNEISEVWRKNFILTFLEKDIPNLGFGYSPEKIRRLWQMIAHSQGQLVNLSELGKSLGISHTMIRQYIDLLEQTYMIRVLQPYFGNTKKRITKTPKIYIRDTGILHSLLRISRSRIFPHIKSSWSILRLWRSFNSILSEGEYGRKQFTNSR